MQLGIFAKTFSGTTPQDVLTSAVKAGFHAAHYNFACSGLSSMPDDIPAGCAEEVAAAARRLGVRIVGLSATWNMAHPDPLVRRKGLERLATMAAKTHALGTRLITLCTGTRDPDDQWRYHPDNHTADAWRDMIMTMREAVAIADQYDLDLGIEPELANIVNNISMAEQLFSEIASPRMKLVLDPANLFEHASVGEVRSLVDDAMKKLGSKLAMAHAKDRNAAGNFVAAGTGIVDFDHFIRCLRDAGFEGPLVTHGLAADETPAVSEVLRDLLIKHGCLA